MQVEHPHDSLDCYFWFIPMGLLQTGIETVLDDNALNLLQASTQSPQLKAEIIVRRIL